MKTCIIIGCHPNNLEKTDILEECIDAFRHLDLPIIASSHVLPHRTTADHFIFNKHSDSITPEEIFKIQRPDSQHLYYEISAGKYVSHANLLEQEPSYHYDALQNVRLAMKYAKSMGFTHCIVSDGDNIFHRDDLQILLQHIDYEKKALFYRGAFTKLNAYSSLVYFSEIDFFMSYMHYETKDAYLRRSEEIRDYTLEKHYFASFVGVAGVKEIHTQEFNISDIFHRSRMDSLTSTNTESSINVCKAKHGEEIFYFTYDAVGKLRIYNGETLVVDIIIDRPIGWEYGRLVGAENWDQTIRFEHTRNGVTKYLEMDQETWKKHLSLNYIDFHSNI